MNDYLNEKIVVCRVWLIIGSLICMSSIIIGAFAAHALKATLNEYQLDIIDTAAQYQMYSGLAMLIISTLFLVLPMTLRSLHLVNSSFAGACLLFSGSLYLLATTGNKIFAYFTPLGGALFIISWCLLIGLVIKSTSVQKSIN